MEYKKVSLKCFKMLHFEVMFGQLPCFKQQSVELPTLKGKTLSKSVPSAYSIVAPTLAHIEKAGAIVWIRKADHEIAHVI